MIEPGRGEPVLSPADCVEATGLRAACDAAVLVYSDRVLDALRAALEGAVEAPWVPGVRGGGVAGAYEGVGVCAYRPCTGAPASAIVVECLAAVGVRRFVVLGQCGAVSPSVRVYDVVVPTWGVREEGTSYHYLPPAVTPEPSRALTSLLAARLRRALRGLGVRLHLGGVWSTDAIFRETRDKVERYASTGVLCVDMESTALMAVAAHRGLEIALAHTVTDELHTPKWRMYEDPGRMARVEEAVARAALEALAARRQAPA